ncbi:hypothetical protein U1Q18_028206 [Sarracenia purpurea var. burkii]
MGAAACNETEKASKIHGLQIFEHLGHYTKLRIKMQHPTAAKKPASCSSFYEAATTIIARIAPEGLPAAKPAEQDCLARNSKSRHLPAATRRDAP